MLIEIVYLIIGGIMLYLGAEGLVRGSVAIAFRMGISALVIGLTFVAFGTSSPELVVSLSAAHNGDSEIALGNVIGSNIANVALILGAASLIKPIDVNPAYLKKDLIIMLGVSVLMIILIMDGKIGFYDGLLFTVGIFAYIFYSFYSARKKKKLLDEITQEIPKSKRNLGTDILFFIGGLLILIFGARFFVDGAVSIAEAIGVSKTVIGISVVAFGTSLPELATSIVAALKGESDVSLGNVVGSNIFNILMILGITGLIFPIPASEVNWIDLFLMLGVSVIIIPLSYFGKKLSRIDGLILLSIYGGYIYYLFIQ
jgi:cation:H+ antiporter